MNALCKGVLRALAYAAIFRYPLRLEEIDRYFIGPRPLHYSRSKLVKALNYLLEKKAIAFHSGYYFLPGQTGIVNRRLQHESYSGPKLALAKKTAFWLGLIPAVRLIGITGSLAMSNCRSDDDIDLIIISSPHRLWLTRFASIIITEILGRRRRRTDCRVSNKICLNMFLDTDHLSLPPAERNLYAAHEITQIKTLVNRCHTYERFLAANRWLNQYLPNAKADRQKSPPCRQKSFILLDFLEKMFFSLQLKKMSAYQTNEIAEPGRIRFHPLDCTGRILVSYRRRLTRLGLSQGQNPLDKNITSS